MRDHARAEPLAAETELKIVTRTNRQSDLIERVEAALPIDDIVGWLIREHPGASERDIMGMIQRVYARDYTIAPASSEIQSYRAGDNTWEACPQRVERS